MWGIVRPYQLICVRLVAGDKRPLGFGERDHQRHGLDRRRLKSVSLIESFRLGRNLMHENRAHTDCRAGGNGPQDGVAEQISAQPFALHGAVDRQTSQQYYWYRIWHVSPHPTRRRAREQ